MTTILKNRYLLSIDDYTSEEITLILAAAAEIKKRSYRVANIASGMTMAMIFEKPSLRTRVTFETGMTQMGGHAIYLQPSDIGIGKRETAKDVALNLSRWVNIIMARVFEHKTVEELAYNATIPVINALSDYEHPCQALADFQTIIEKKGDPKGLTLAYVGDGNNVTHSLMLLAAKLGTNIRVGCPAGYEPDEAVTARTLAICKETGSEVIITADPIEAVTGADAIYTDVWTSMGQEEEAEKRKQIFPPYQLNSRLLNAANPGALVMHCMPAHRGEEITDEVIDGPQSVVFDEAENRLHAQKAVIALALGWKM
ncbi:MAG: ornithine carbamoyltransferase [bacterium]